MKFDSLSSRLTVSIIGIVMLTVFAITLFAKEQTEAFFLKSIEENALNLLESNYNSIKIAHESILYHKATTLSRRKKELRDNTIIAEAIVRSAYNKWRDGIVDEQTAKQFALEELKQLRYSEGVGYFWINDTSSPLPRMIMHPTLPRLEGDILDSPSFSCADGECPNLFSTAVNICLKNGDGYIEYFWPKPTGNGLTENQKKISFVKLFAPWNWVIGTGLYVDDIEKEVNHRINAVIADLNRIVARQKIASNGYCFIFDESNKMIAHPNPEKNEGTGMIDPETGGSLLDRFKAAVKSGKPTVDYLWDKPENEKEHFRKKAFLAYFEPLEWYIATSYYIDDLERNGNDLTRMVIIFSVVLVILAALLSCVLGNSIVKPLNALSRAVHDTGPDGLPSGILPVSGTRETVELGSIINNMIGTIRHSKRRLKESEEKFRAVFNQTFQYTVILATDGRVMDVNVVSQEAVGAEKHAFIGKPVWETPWWHSHEMKTKLRQAISDASSGELVRFEASYPQDAGNSIYIDFSLKPVTDDRNRVFALIAEGRDITERKQVENELRQNRESLRTILNSIGDAVIATDTEGRITNMNPFAENHTGWRLAEAKGKPFSTVFRVLDPHSDAPITPPVEQVLQTGKPAGHTDKAHLVGRNGALRLISNSCSPIYDSNKVLNGAVLVFRDISEEHALQTQLQHSRKMDAIGQLAGGVAHDINNMLGGIMGGVEMLQMQYSGDPIAQESLDLIMTASERASELISKLLAFARKGKMVSAPVDVHDAIMNAFSLLKHSIDKRVVLNCDLRAEKSIVMGDLSQLQSVFLNLGLNAVHAMPEGGRLRFHTRTLVMNHRDGESGPLGLKPGNYIQIEVQDTGCGIAEEDLPKIFEPFFTTRRHGEGTGLGLAAAYGTIEQHQGAVTVDSKVARGTTFTLFLPIAKSEEKKTPAENRPPVSGSGKILVIEDEAVVRTFTRKLLSDLGYDVILAENGKVGLEIFSRDYRTIDLVILDMVMPEMNGRDCFVGMKAIDPAVRIIILSGYTRDTDIRLLKDLGLCGVVRKPYRLHDLSKTVAEAMRRKECPPRKSEPA